jgi:Uncharacterized conserved protein
MAWPEKTMHGHSRAWDLDHLYSQMTRGPDPSRDALVYPGQEWLMGYALPPFQRPVVWDEERMVRFVESAIRGVHLGRFVYNNAKDAPMERVDGREVFHRTDRWLVDGQQRLTALERYFNDAFPVFGLLWSEVGERDRRRLLRTPFEAEEVSLTDETELRELYDLMNFGGIAHSPDQRATAEEDDVPLPRP